MDLTGAMLIGGEAVVGGGDRLYAHSPATGQRLEPGFGSATPEQLARACTLAAEAFDVFRDTSLLLRARLLETIGAHILECGELLLERGIAETGLPRARLEGERTRTVGQLRLFADVARRGDFLDVRIDTALPERRPVPRPDLRERHIALGPVAIFSASNFPLAFSVAGGDTAAALAAGCPVIVKAHNAHPGLSELVGRAVQRAVAACGLPPGVFALLFGPGTEIGAALVADSRIKAVGFTGSRSGGRALMAVAAARAVPIPVHAEMSSINPVFMLPNALQRRAEQIAEDYVASVVLGAGQFCTNPGIGVGAAGEGMDRFTAAAARVMGKADAATMLTPAIHRAYEDGIDRVAGIPGVIELASGGTGGRCQGQPRLFSASSEAFLNEAALKEEVFGAASLLVVCRNADEMQRIAESLEGQLTSTLQMESEDLELARRLLPTLERKAGRIIVNGFPTGVEVAPAMVHGGPYPATSDPRFTSVGTLSIRRFLRPVCYQGFSDSLLPDSLRHGNPLGITRQVNGQTEQ